MIITNKLNLNLYFLCESISEQNAAKNLSIIIIFIIIINIIIINGILD